MAKNDVEIRLVVQDELTKQYKRIAKEINSSNKKAENSVKKLGKTTKKTSDSVKKNFTAMKVAAAAFAAFMTGKVAGSLIETQRNLDRVNNALIVGTGSAEKAQVEFAFLQREAKRLGLEFSSTALSYAQLTAAAKSSNLTSEDQREIFLGVSEAAAALGLSADDAKGALLAVQQIISKGTVQAEELRGQLGERIPGAFGLAAKSMGVTEKELGKLLETGKVTAEDMLPRFANELRKTFGATAAKGPTTLNGRINILKNTINEIQRAILGGGGLELLTGFFEGANKGLQLLQGNLGRFIKDHFKDMMSFLNLFGINLPNALKIGAFALKAFLGINSLVTAGLLTTVEKIMIVLKNFVQFASQVKQAFGGEPIKFIDTMQKKIEEIGEIAQRNADRAREAFSGDIFKTATKQAEKLNQATGGNKTFKPIEKQKSAGAKKAEQKALQDLQSSRQAILLLNATSQEQELAQLKQFEEEKKALFVDGSVERQLLQIEVAMKHAEITKRFQDEEKEGFKKLQDDKLKILEMNEKALAQSRQTEAANFVNNLQTLAQANSKFGAMFKAAAIAQTIVNTIKSARAAFSAFAGIPFVGPALGAAAAATATAAGFVDVAKIKNQKFAQGGIVGGNNFSGDNVNASLNSGELVLNRSQQRNLLAMANGGGSGGASFGDTNIIIQGNADADIVKTAVLETRQEQARMFGGQSRRNTSLQVRT